MTALQKAQAEVTRLIAKAARERDQRGYRENLGYDQRPVLGDFLSTLDLSYSEKYALLCDFDRQCDNL